MGEDIPVARLRAGEDAPEESFWQWRRSIEGYFESVPLHDVRRPEVCLEATVYLLDGIAFHDSTYERQGFQRDRRWGARHDDSDHLLIQVYRSGGNEVVNGTTEFSERPGGVYAVNLSDQVQAVSESSQVMNLILPRVWLKDAVPGLMDARGTVFAPGTGAARVMTDFMLSLRRMLPQAEASDAGAISASVAGLLGGLVRHRDMGAQATAQGVVQAMVHYIDNHLVDPELGVDSLCARFHCSRATLYRLFQPLGGVKACIQRRRLMAAFEALRSPSEAGRSISDIAFSLGFSSSSHFSVQFRRTFGLTPSELRETTGGIADSSLMARGAADTDAEVMFQWSKVLGRSLTET